MNIISALSENGSASMMMTVILKMSLEYKPGEGEEILEIEHTTLEKGRDLICKAKVGKEPDVAIYATGY